MLRDKIDVLFVDAYTKQIPNKNHEKNKKEAW